MHETVTCGTRGLVTDTVTRSRTTTSRIYSQTRGSMIMGCIGCSNSGGIRGSLWVRWGCVTVGGGGSGLGGGWREGEGASDDAESAVGRVKIVVFDGVLEKVRA